MVRKIFKTGNSLVISLPKDSIQHIGLKEGSEVSVKVDRVQGHIIIAPSESELVDIEIAFAQQLDDFIERYRPALEALAK
ncbi:MAG: AbrB/MazE/SpoVT family DNA-binding domain-containing protein [Chloroflexi bacterium]|nr:AbrB/MazE/SpoVT family DNA-binding domain-containing protein [Chloroflexota bacterium]